MTEREDAPSDRLVAGESDEWPVSEESDRAGDLESDQDLRPDSGRQWGDQWPPDGDPQSDDEWPPNGEWDWTELPYDDPAWVSTTGSGPSHRPADRPWYRRPGYLVITALVALVVASVLLDKGHVQRAGRGASQAHHPHVIGGDPLQCDTHLDRSVSDDERHRADPEQHTVGRARACTGAATGPGRTDSRRRHR